MHMTQHHFVAEESWAVIDLDTKAGHVLVSEKWFYDWKLWRGVSAAWTYYEKRAFHDLSDRQIWSAWSYRVFLWATGTSQFAKNFRHRKISVNFDIQWWLKNDYHWKANVWKMPHGASPTGLHRSFVSVPTRTIELNTADIAPRSAGNAAGQSTSRFKTVPHEFGHAMIGPAGHTANPDEYTATSPNLGDTMSMMNIGQELRERHLTATVSALNRLSARTDVLKNSLFSIAEIR